MMPVNGEILLGAGIAPGWAALICLIAVFLVVLEYGRMRRRGTGFRVGLTVLRCLALLLVLGALFRPLRVYPVPEERERSLAVLVDGSRSMGLSLGDGEQSRASWARQALYAEGGLLDGLRRDFRLRVYGFDRSARRLWAADELRADGKGTDLGAALEAAARDPGEATLAGVLLISDGADNSGGDPLRAAQALRQQGAPVHVLAVGREHDLRDLRLVRVEAPEQVETGSLVEIQVEVVSQGFAGREVALEVESDGRTLASQEMDLTWDGTRRIELLFPAGPPGIRRYAVTVPPQEGEVLTANNRRGFALEVVEREEVAVLFLEGRPRPEFAYIKRALGDDEGTVVEAEIAVAADAEYRIHRPLGPSADGLMGYDVVVLGDVQVERLLDGGEAELRRFVGDRGGGLLALGSAALLEAGKGLRDLLPVRLGEDAELDAGGFRTTPASAGRFHPVLGQLGPEVWNRLPELAGYARVGRAKPGATVLLEAGDGGRILMAAQRYGAGKVAFFAPRASWRWRAQTPSNEDEYEQFWRQAVRWLGTRQERPMVLEMEEYDHALGQPVRLAARVWDAAYRPHGRAQVAAAIRRAQEASGEAQLVSLQPAMAEPGLYEAEWDANGEGEFQVDVWAYEAGRRLGEARGFFAVRDVQVELEGRLADRPLLERLAAAGGGLFFTADEVDSVPERLPFAVETTTRQVEEDLWDSPLLFSGILLLLSGEWLWRRRRGAV